MKARGVITEGELRMLVEAVKRCDEEDSEVFCGDSAELADLINSVVESLEDKHTLETIMGEFERYMDEASENYPASRKAIQYIYERALFSLDILLQ